MKKTKQCGRKDVMEECSRIQGQWGKTEMRDLTVETGFGLKVSETVIKRWRRREKRCKIVRKPFTFDLCIVSCQRWEWKVQGGGQRGPEQEQAGHKGFYL